MRRKTGWRNNNIFRRILRKFLEKVRKMKWGKRILVIVVCAACLAGTVAGIWVSKNWVIRYQAELDDFFGKGNWKCISEETKDSIIYSKYIIIHSNPELSGDVPGKFHNWYIEYKDAQGETQIWEITDHVLKINHDRYDLFSSKRYSGRQALTLELMEISFGMIGEKLIQEMQGKLSQAEAACFEASISYEGGNPPPEFYDELAAQPWFHADTVTADNYLNSGLYDFYLYIRAFDYRLDKLSDSEKEQVYQGMEQMEQELLEQYGDHASFEIYVDAEHKAEYRNGKKQ